MRAFLIMAASAALAGCVVHVRPLHSHVVYHEPPAEHRAPVVEHVHTDHCGHYYHNGGWFIHTGHVHGAGCGHHYHGGRWTLVREYTPPVKHVCMASCDHYHHDGRWYVMTKHVHGPGCGHALRAGIWVVLR